MFSRFEQTGLTVPADDALAEFGLATPEPSALPQFANLAAGPPRGTNS